MHGLLFPSFLIISGLASSLDCVCVSTTVVSSGGFMRYQQEFEIPFCFCCRNFALFSQVMLSSSVIIVSLLSRSKSLSSYFPFSISYYMSNNILSKINPSNL
jgi:hypothetical protein